jgi:hypothetical protein
MSRTERDVHRQSLSRNPLFRSPEKATMRSTSSTIVSPFSIRRNRTKRGGNDGLISLQRLVLTSLMMILMIYVVGFWTIVHKQPDKPTVAEVIHDEYDRMAAQHLGADEQERERAPVREQQIHQPLSQEKDPSDVTVGWAVTITGCGADPITEGAAVLKHSIHLSSIHGNMGGRYDYKMYAIYHPEGLKCAKTLESLGYTLVERETFVKVEEIKGDFLRERIHQNGCCGERELVKLEAYTLTDHPVIVHMDLDTVVLRPLDELFDWMMAEPSDTPYDASDVALQWPNVEHPKRVNVFFTRDCKLRLGVGTKLSLLRYSTVSKLREQITWYRQHENSSRCRADLLFYDLT